MADAPHLTDKRMRELIAARAQRLATVAMASGRPSPELVARFLEQLLDVSIAFCGEALAKAFYQRMLKDTRVRAGLCVDCGTRPALRAGLMCATCQAAEDAAQAQVNAELAMEFAAVTKAVN